MSRTKQWTTKSLEIKPKSHNELKVFEKYVNKIAILFAVHMWFPSEVTNNERVFFFIWRDYSELFINNYYRNLTDMYIVLRYNIPKEVVFGRYSENVAVNNKQPLSLYAMAKDLWYL